MNYYIKDNNLHIYDSYKISKKAMVSILETIAEDDCYHSNVWLRSIGSLRDEWIVHNFLYSINYHKEQTKEVDLDYPCDRDERLYRILAFIVYPFVK